MEEDLVDLVIPALLGPRWIERRRKKTTTSQGRSGGESQRTDRDGWF
jgi:hypothetical protein